MRGNSDARTYSEPSRPRPTRTRMAWLSRKARFISRVNHHPSQTDESVPFFQNCNGAPDCLTQPHSCAEEILIANCSSRIESGKSRAFPVVFVRLRSTDYQCPVGHADLAGLAGRLGVWQVNSDCVHDRIHFIFRQHVNDRDQTRISLLPCEYI